MSDPSSLTKSFGSYDEANSSKGLGFLGILMAEGALPSDEDRRRNGVSCYFRMTKYQLITNFVKISN